MRVFSMPRFPIHVDLRYIRDVIIVGVGAACLVSQILAQQAKVDTSGELIVAGVTLLTATPFLWKGDERTDESKRGKHEAH
jgi:hypothetical protein